MPTIHVILNPNARRNRTDTEARAAMIRRILGSQGAVHCTRTLAELRQTLERLAITPADYVVCDGGDGSVHWAVNTLADLCGGDEARLPIFVPARAGTIDFVATKAGIFGSPTRVIRDLTSALRRGARPRTKELDTLRIEGIESGPSGTRAFSRIGFALAAGGVGARFFDRYYEERSRGRRAIAKILSRAVGSHLSARARLPVSQDFRDYGRDLFRPTLARVTIDGKELATTEHGALHAGSIDVNFRGMLRVFPLAKQSGVLHFQAGSILPGEIIRSLPRLYRGAPLSTTGLTELAGKEMTIVPLDGELNPIIDGERFEHLQRLCVERGPKVRVPTFGVDH
ncbi:MAG TPA: diacylglycerol kinase family protein [Polyangiaceae bacterium]